MTDANYLKNNCLEKPNTRMNTKYSKKIDCLKPSSIKLMKRIPNIRI